jgi:hypothetical protein
MVGKTPSKIIAPLANERPTDFTEPTQRLDLLKISDGSDRVSMECGVWPFFSLPRPIKGPGLNLLFVPFSMAVQPNPSHTLAEGCGERDNPQTLPVLRLVPRETGNHPEERGTQPVTGALDIDGGWQDSEAATCESEGDDSRMTWSNATRVPPGSSQGIEGGKTDSHCEGTDTIGKPEAEEGYDDGFWKWNAQKQVFEHFDEELNEVYVCPDSLD